MRITADLFVAQLIRRVFADGGFAAVERRGAEAAGAIFVVVRHRDGSVQLYAPAVQALADEDGERRFMTEPQKDPEALAKRFEREARFDPDFWVVELETDDVSRYLMLAEAG
ncbi:DUF1491 family protein [Aureimonas sp. OT7]|uniref:DUF1491 family protein n=1 Tax=Aureimonas altamirensis TaxID=370622 RepID=A0A0B1Q7M6_9HYPH|nr:MULTISPECIES: DUF1491 family protein [Aureimonas]KHJ54917.1 hypothetical protein LA66_10225 [Aureimonas altamirensis]QOG06021.1 DUF1491 family protein [Aureimonas sp. OT7]